jgi:UDP-N-acetylmuramoyl-tripeptide--D-alanyl-D-alanine ligase
VSAADAALDTVLGIGLAGAYVAQMSRWLRVLQREHYDPSAMCHFVARWAFPSVASARGARLWTFRPVTAAPVLAVGFLVALLFDQDRWTLVATILFGLATPWGLGLRGRTGKLAFTRRLRMLALVAALLALVLVVVGVFLPRPWILAALAVWFVPLELSVAARLRSSSERSLASVFVAQAKERLARINPLIVGITGSYGKTSTKNHLAALLQGEDGVVASPRSYNNRAGLSRAINENLAEGTKIFIAEMGTYGPGEIAELCSWCPPEISVVTAIGPVHLERMKSLDVIERAKFEITETARVVVLNVDDERLASWVQRLENAGKKVRTAGSLSEMASVRVVEGHGQWQVLIDGTVRGSVDVVPGLQPTNVACAIGAALEIGAGEKEILHQLDFVTPVANRANVVVAPSGVTVIDDTFNANPASARASIALLASLPLSGRSVVVTPGLIELGPEQFDDNASLARDVRRIGAELVVVGRTNAASLARGYGAKVRRFARRDQAVTWVRTALTKGDGVLYLNDLPDHYP